MLLSTVCEGFVFVFVFSAVMGLGSYPELHIEAHIEGKKEERKNGRGSVKSGEGEKKKVKWSSNFFNPRAQLFFSLTAFYESCPMMTPTTISPQ